MVDLQAVVDFLKSAYGYIIELLVGHSRGSIVAFKWLAATEDGRKVPAFVNASGRYRMAVGNFPFLMFHFLRVVEAYSVISIFLW